MTLKSALQDVKETTLAAVSGLLGKLAYLASLRRTPGRYEHWGMEMVHGPESSDRALRAAHAEVVTRILRSPIEFMEQDLRESSRKSSVSPREYVEEMRGQFAQLLPGDRTDTPAAKHLNSVLGTLSSLEKNRERATQ
jgi:hypothetical protein